MLYNLFNSLTENYTVFNLFHYITFRSGCSFFTSLFICLYLIPKLINFQKRKIIGQPIRNVGPESHQVKKGTPTMGGLIMLIASIISTILWADLNNGYIWIVIFSFLLFGIIGLTDDILKVYFKHSAGLNGKAKFICQLLVSLLTYFWIQKYVNPIYTNTIAFPFIKDTLFDIGYLYIAFICFVIVGTSNAVNLTDGLDGLATVPIALCLFCFGSIAYIVGSSKFADHLQLFYIEHAAEIAIFSAATIGACLGFLWYNCSPAEIMMGDVGSLCMCGVIGVISVITKQELNLAIIGGLFVIETLSVMIQVTYFKISGGKRIFKMSPIHHHFEKSGWSETKVVVRFWIIALMFAVIGLSTLKIR